MEALGLGLFMVSAGVFGTLLEYPGSPLHQALPSAFGRRALMGIAMGLTAIGLVYSPWGRRSGAHINPAFTLTFFRLGRVRRRCQLLGLSERDGSRRRPPCTTSLLFVTGSRAGQRSPRRNRSIGHRRSCHPVLFIGVERQARGAARGAAMR